jgi:hypothetical protein
MLRRVRQGNAILVHADEYSMLPGLRQGDDPDEANGHCRPARARERRREAVSACEKCWRDAHRSDDVAAEYNRLIEERKVNPCTPEEQSGEDAGVCHSCGRKTLHQWTRECMAGCPAPAKEP